MWAAFVVFSLAFVVLGSIPADTAAACSPRTFSSIQPPADDVPPTDPVASDSEPSDPADPEPTADGDGGTAEPADAEPTPSDEPWTPPPPTCRWVYRMEFPVIGGDAGWSLFGEPRDAGERLHAGVDILAPKLTPVVAVRSGTVLGVHDEPDDCCWVSIQHTDGWISMYVHLNNDTFGTDDGAGIGIRPDLEEGMPIAQGELIGWVGDSGNAETADPHLHFELRTPWGEPVDPGPSLYSARWRSHASIGDDSIGLTSGPYLDDDLFAGATLFDTATAIGVQAWCDDFGVRSCPGDDIGQATVERWITHLSGSGDVPREYFLVERSVDDPTAQLSLLAECDRPAFCVDHVTRGEVALLVLRSLDPLSTADEAGATALLHSRGITDGCVPGGPDPDEPMSRVGALRMLLRAWGYIDSPPCSLIA